MRDLQIQDTESNKEASFESQFLAAQEREKSIKESINLKQHELGSLQSSLHDQEILIQQVQMQFDSSEAIAAARTTVEQCKAAIESINAQILPTNAPFEEAQNAFDGVQQAVNHAQTERDNAQDHRNSISWDSYKWTEWVYTKVRGGNFWRHSSWENIPHERHNTPQYEQDVADADNRLHNANMALNVANQALQAAQETLDGMHATRADLFAQKSEQEQSMHNAQAAINRVEEELGAAKARADVLKGSIGEALKEIESSRTTLKAIEKESLESIMQLGSLIKQGELKGNNDLVDKVEDIDGSLYVKIESVEDTDPKELSEAGKFLVFSHD